MWSYGQAYSATAGKAFLVGNKNDYNDALAIAVAAGQPHIKTVCANTIEQQDSQALHKARELAIRQRTALCNQIRGLSAEYGICIARGLSTVRQSISVWLTDECTQLSALFKHLLFQLKEQLNMLDVSIEVFNEMINTSVKENEALIYDLDRQVHGKTCRSRRCQL